MTNERTHLDLFSGLCGFALAARANNVRTIGFVEIDERCREFLAKAWPGVPIHADIRSFVLANPSGVLSCRTWNEQKQSAGQETAQGNLWLLTGGFPCQPYSCAGKQRGNADDRALWPEMLRVITVTRPTWVLGENVAGIHKLALDGVLADLESEGYATRTFGIPACALDAPHGRERYWIVGHRMADTSSQGRGQVSATGPDGRQTSESQRLGQLANAPQRGQREHGSAPRETGHADQCGQNRVALGNTRHEPNGTKQQHEQGQESRWGPKASNTAGSGPSSHWSNHVWLPCADGKVRRAPDDTQRMVNGLPVELLEALGEEGTETPEACTPHRSLLGALGNAIVWQLAAELIHCMTQADL